MRKIDIEQAKTYPEILFNFAATEEILITQNKQPMFKITRVHQSPKRRTRGSAKNLISIAPDFEEPLEDFQEYMA